MGVNGKNPLMSRWLQGSLVLYPPTSPGNIFHVNSNVGSDNNTGLDWENALATIDAGVDKCVTLLGDQVWVHPHHAETISADSAIDVDVIGVQIIGIRQGRQMPTITYDDPDGDLKLAAAGTSVKNIRFLGGVDIGTGCLEVSAADCSVLDCEYRDVTGQATDALITTAGADRLLIDGWRHIGAAAAGGDSAIAIVGADDVVIRNFEIYGNFAVGAIDFRTTLSARVNVHSGKIWTANAADIAIVDTITSSTGWIGPDIEIMLTDDAANITEAVTGATFQLVDPVYVVNKVNEKALLINWTASTD